MIKKIEIYEKSLDKRTCKITIKCIHCKNISIHNVNVKSLNGRKYTYLKVVFKKVQKQHCINCGKQNFL